MNHHVAQIGGPSITVEIDESKFGKRKFNRGRYIEEQWVFGGIKSWRQTKACFLVPVGKRDKRHKHSLLPIIRAHPHIAGYMRQVKGLRLPKRRGLHSSHSQPQPKLRRPWHRGAHTQRIENTWWGVKRGMPRTEHPLQEWLWGQLYRDDPLET